MTQANDKGIFINGREQAIELIQRLDPEHRQRLLNNIKLRNPQVASELEEKSFSFDDLDKLQDYQLSALTGDLAPEIIGIALKLSNSNFQRRVLGLMSRERAELAYKAMVSGQYNSRLHCQRARNKIMSMARIRFS